MIRFEKIVGILLIMLLVSCSVQRKLEKNTLGKSMYEIVSERGKPAEIRDLRDGGKLYVYKEYKYLKAAPINTDSFQYEKIQSAGGMKEIITYISFSVEGKATEVEIEEDFQ